MDTRSGNGVTLLMAASLPRPVSAVRLDGGRLCIDFANTIHDRFAVEVEDYIATPERYLEWAGRAGAIDIGRAADLPVSAEGRERLMTDVRSLRDAAFALLSASADRLTLPREPLRVENHWLMRARESQSMTEDGVLTLRADPGDWSLPLKAVALDLVETIADARAGRLRLKHCANRSSCGWLFADTSKNGLRRWCSMQTCGTVSKMATRRAKGTARA